MHRNPYFSIVIPVYNREREIVRAIDSCLAQDFEDHEVIVVDDHSSDGTASVVAGYRDPRVRLLRHARNRGVCPARNTAIRASKAAWIIFLDSDDEMLPGCLRRMFEVVSSGADGVGRVGFRWKFDDGRVSPCPLPPAGVLGFEDWIRFIERAGASDAIWANRRETFDRCMLPESFALETKYNLDFSKNFTWKIVPEPLALVHTDAPRRLSFFACSSDDSATDLRREIDALEQSNLVVEEYGPILKRLAPGRYQGILRRRAMSFVLTGRRLRAIGAGLGCVCRYPSSLMNWAVFFSVLLGRRTTRWARARRARRHVPAVPQAGSLTLARGSSPAAGL